MEYPFDAKELVHKSQLCIGFAEVVWTSDSSPSDQAPILPHLSPCFTMSNYDAGLDLELPMDLSVQKGFCGVPQVYDILLGILSCFWGFWRGLWFYKK